MDATAEKIIEQALAMPPEARAQLADRLVESLDPAADEPLRRIWAAEAVKRRDDVRAGRMATIPGERALAEVREAFGG